jgi:hypothetical protein
MKISQKQYFILILAIISFILLYNIFRTIDYLSRKQYIMEYFSNENTQKQSIMSQTMNKYLNDTATSYSVDLPLTTTYNCKNFCSPNSRCIITGQQCLADIDCPGCKPYSSSNIKSKDCIPGNDDAGKLTIGVTPQYSSLTAGYGTKEMVISNNINDRPLRANLGIDTWGESFNEGQVLFNKRYKPDQLQYMPNYPAMYSLTGEFVSEGPLPSNY